MCNTGLLRELTGNSAVHTRQSVDHIDRLCDISIAVGLLNESIEGSRITGAVTSLHRTTEVLGDHGVLVGEIGDGVIADDKGDERNERLVTECVGESARSARSDGHIGLERGGGSSDGR